MRYTKHILLLGIVLFISSFLQAQTTTINFTSADIMSDAMVANGVEVNTNFGSQTKLKVYSETSKAYRTFIQYDISSIPSNAVIIEAKLKFVPLSVDNAMDHPIYIDRVGDTTWDEDSITWNNQPSVVTGDELAFPHVQTLSTTLQEFNVTDHVQKMVNYPTVNNGWRIRLRSETGSLDFGLKYNSSESVVDSLRPVLAVEYILPIEMITSVNHCTAGNSDGTFSVDISGGSSYNLSNMYLYKTNRDLSYRGKATLSNVKVINNLQYNISTGLATAENLDPGIYILRILDHEYYTSSDQKYTFYKHILVGREGETTSGILLPNKSYQENTSIAVDKPTNGSPLNRANTNYHNNDNVIALRVADAPNVYEFASLIKYELDFDDQLDFSKAELQMRAWSKFYHSSTSSNAINLNLITSDWEEDVVTWNTRPTVDLSNHVYVPQTTPIGYDNAHKYDTISILNFVEIWQENPADNYGFEIALETYGATNLAQRSYKSAGNDINYICFEFTVKPPTVVSYDDSKGLGSLTVNAPIGELPYTYLIDTKALRSLDLIWNEINDWDIIDSTSFFEGNVNSKHLTFTDLPSGEYHIGVYDNNGVQIQAASGIVTPDFQLYNSHKLNITEDDIVSRTGSHGIGRGRLYAELMNGESSGGIMMKVQDLDEFNIGFNKSSDPVPSSISEIEFGLAVSTSGSYQVILNNAVVSIGSGSLSVGSEIYMAKENADYVLIVDGVERYRGAVTDLNGHDISVDLVLNGLTKLKMKYYTGKLKIIHYYTNINYPECGEYTGSMTLHAGFGISINTVSLVNNHTLESVIGAIEIGGASAVFGSIPIGSYTLTTTYTGVLGGVSTVTEQIAIGYIVEWEDLYQNEVIPLTVNTIQPLPYILIGDPWSTANSTNVTTPGYLNWVQFETKQFTGPFGGVSSASQTFILRNAITTDNAYSFTTSFVWNSLSYASGIGTIGTLSSPNPNGIWRIDQNGTTFSLFKNGEDDVVVDAAGAVAPFEIAIKQKGNVKYVKTIASFCSDYPIADQYIEPKRENEGGHYLVPVDDLLRFEFDKEYTLNTDLKYIVRDFTQAPMAGLSALTEMYGDNRFQLDVSSLAPGVYIMEIENDKGENWFIRFKVQ